MAVTKQKTPAVQYTGVITKMIYQNPANGFAIFAFKAEQGNGEISCKGYLQDGYNGGRMTIEGHWVKHPKYGDQLEIESCCEVLPTSAEGIANYLSSGLIKGIGETLALRIVGKFGDKTLDVLDQQPKLLLEVEGIGKKKYESILAGWQKNLEMRDIMLFLKQHDISNNMALKIYKTYGIGSIAQLKANPYRMADDIDGVGFKRSDEIALKIGVAKDDPLRIRSGIQYVLKVTTERGNVYAVRDELVQNTQKLLGTDNQSRIENALNDLLFENAIISDGDALYTKENYEAECGVANKLYRLSRYGMPRGLLSEFPITDLEQATGKQYDDIQKNAIRKAAKSGIFILTGGPGTGKTTTIQAIVKLFQLNGLTVRLAAPTGRAAKRMTEAIGLEATTIHRLLEYSYEFKKNEYDPLEGDVLIVDECSMIDILLMNALLKAVPLNMRLIMVGDIDQLPSVGPGNVLRDIITSGVCPTVMLKTIFRQAQGSKIVTNAHVVNSGHCFEFKNDPASDFHYIEEYEQDYIARKIVDMVKNQIPKQYGIKPEDIQVISPMRKLEAGTASLNQKLQEALNPLRGDYAKKHTARSSSTEFRINDKVIQLKNNYDKNVFNGDIGIVKDINPVDQCMIVTFDSGNIEYDFLELDELALAYAVTVHKAQGSEYPAVVMALSMSNAIMLQRNLLYTGITRAKKQFFLVGEDKAVKMAVHNNDVRQRNTKLLDRITSLIAGGGFQGQVAV